MPPNSALLFFIILLSISTALESKHSCSSTAAVTERGSSRSPCPPFNTSTPPFPFYTSLGCGHPSFRIICAHPHSIITINNHRFYILSYDPNNTSLRLSLIYSNSSNSSNSSQGCSTLPRRTVNLSGSPFRVSESSCSRLSLLRPCSPLNCTTALCPWECRIIRKPLILLHDCGSGSAEERAVSEQGCQTDVLEYLDEFLKRFGIEIEWDEGRDAYFSSCRDCKATNGLCGFDSSDPAKKFLCFNRESTITLPWIRQQRINFVVTVFIIVSLLVLITLVSLKFRSLRKKSEDTTTLFLRRQRSASLLPPLFTYDELESATDRFDSRRKVGDGGFGSVYVAQLNDGRVVAVKHLHTSSASSSFCNEILILSSIEHPNLVKLHGYCSDPRGLLLVYDFFSNGTLADHLHKQKASEKLTWLVRMDIAIQVAAAIEYLHFSVKPPVVHRDITSSNIFVERNMRVKVGDFGLSRLMVGPEMASSGSVTTSPQGTPGYLDPDYHRCFRLTEKSDVYSFGVVLMELITGMRAVDVRRDMREILLADLVVARIQTGRFREVVDDVFVLDNGELVDEVGAAAELAFRCVAADKDDRPDMAEVLVELKRIKGK